MSYNININGIRWLANRNSPADLIQVKDGIGNTNSLYLEFTHGDKTDYKVTEPNIIIKDETSTANNLRTEISDTMTRFRRDMAESIARFRRCKRHCLECVETEFYLTSLNSRDGVVYMHEMRDINSTQNEKNLRELISNAQLEYDDPKNHVKKDFSVIIIEGKVKTGNGILTDSHASTLIVEHKDPKRLFLFDTSEDIHQKRDSATGTVSASAEIFGNLANNIRCLNTTGQALQDDSSCTYWTTYFVDILQNYNSISDIIKGQQNQEFLNPDVLDKTIDRLCQIDSNMVIGLNDPHMKNFAPDSPAGNLLQFLKNKMNIRQNLSVLTF